MRDHCCWCGRETCALSVEGWCASCVRLAAVEAVHGIRQIGDYLAKVARFEAYLAEHGVSA